jgi:hypothetical protein
METGGVQKQGAEQSVLYITRMKKKHRPYVSFPTGMEINSSSMEWWRHAAVLGT